MDDRKNFNDELFRLSIEADERNLARNVQALEVTVAVHGETRFSRAMAKRIRKERKRIKEARAWLRDRELAHKQG